jgi:hypothetical protein
VRPFDRVPRPPVEARCPTCGGGWRHVGLTVPVQAVSDAADVASVRVSVHRDGKRVTYVVTAVRR